MNSLEEELRKLNATNIKLGDKKSKGMPNNLSERTLTLAAMMFGSGYTLTESVNVSEMQKKVEWRVAREFMSRINSQAVMAPKLFWHAYETNQIGVTQGRLFDLQASDRMFKSVMRMNLSFRPSKMMAHVPEELATPGKNGKFVKRRHKFPNKAFAYEYGETLNIAPRKAKALAFLSDKPGGRAIRLPSGNYIRFVFGKVVVDTRKQATFQQVNMFADRFFDSAAPRIAQQVYNTQAKYMQEAGELAVKKTLTVKKPTGATVKAIGKKIAKQMSKR